MSFRRVIRRFRPEPRFARYGNELVPIDTNATLFEKILLLIAIGGVIAGISVIIWAAVSEGSEDDEPSPSPSPSPTPPSPSPSPAPSPEPSTGISSGALIAAIVASVVAAIILFAAAIFAVGKRRPMNQGEVLPGPDREEDEESEASRGSFGFDVDENEQG
ncbi:hypothetical protein [Sicyoidochytrium minutum DNA virus]|nr:hypothetical protein [Sicyoidochytrium minutum DNA virus]